MAFIDSVVRRLGKHIGPILTPYRQATWRLRPLPHFVIIGAQKSGTSSLFRYLAQHPRLRPSFVKEVHYFDGGTDPQIDTFERGESWYRAHFPLLTGRKTQYAFEASPLYLFSPWAPPRIHELIPSSKLIAILRSPVERAISHYFHVRRFGDETLPIWDALMREEERLAPVIAEQDFKSATYVRASYKSRGLYAEQLERYFALFRRQQLLVLNSEELFRDPVSVLEQVYAFLGVEAQMPANLKPRNVGKNRQKVEERVYSYLSEYFEPHNDRLFKLIGRKFDW